MTASKSVDAREDVQRDEPNLDGRYGKIGISAVAAAIRFRSETRHPNNAPSVQYDYD